MKINLQFTLANMLPFILIIASIVGLVASSVLTYDQVKIWQNPNYSAPCSINPVLSCGTVINSGQGHVFGIPAPFLGFVMFSALGTVGVVLLAGAKFKRWFWIALQAAVTGGAFFAFWLFWVSVYQINALCPYCLATDAAVYTVAWYVTLYNIRRGHILKGRHKKLTGFCLKHHLDILFGFFFLIAAFILKHFWYYYGRNF